MHDRDITHVIIEIFGGDNNLSRFVFEDLQEMASGNRGRYRGPGARGLRQQGRLVVVELSPRAGNHVVEELGEINTGDLEILATFLARALATYGPDVRKAIGFWDHGSRSLRRAGREPDRARTPDSIPCRATAAAGRRPARKFFSAPRG